eukprot:TRINITY_DN9929_c0_g1_i1.p1 TRINITY_DN9929_c0_g1~~TRINITY_DN9929_c0_g1_i1.p1  ORF type:complete len:369 (-),score=57.73 TRINITY_DN9929_c0_g1_i1:571-1656(-)
MVSFFLCVCTVLSLVVAMWLYTTNQQRRRSSSPLPPSASGGVPLLGHALAMVKDPPAFYTQMREEHGKVCTVSLVGRKVVLVTDRELAHELFHVRDDVLSFLGITTEFAIDRVNNGPGVPQMDFDVVIPAIKRSIALNVDKVMVDVLDSLLDDLPSPSGVFDPFVFAKKAVANITSRAFFGVTFDSNVMEHFFSFEQNAVSVMGLSFFIPTWILEYTLMSSVDKKRDTFHSDLLPYLELMKKSENKPLFLQEILNYRNPSTGQGYSDERLIQIITSIQAVAVSNTSMAVAQMLMRTVERKDIMDEVISELESSLYDARSCKLMHAIALETARIDALPVTGMRVDISFILFLRTFYFILFYL